MLTQSGIVRSDIRSSFGASGTNVATGTPLSLSLQFLSTVDGCGPIEGLAVYVWHCDRQGRYSMYSQGVSNENYLRGVQIADSSGKVTFTSIFPACYSGRWPHVHFEVYPDEAGIADADKRICTSQLAFPKDVCDVVYATDRYSGSQANLAGVSLTTDNVFGEDGAAHQMATVTGSVDDGYQVALTVPIDTTTTPTGGSAPGGGR